jgi:K319-like protein
MNILNGHQIFDQPATRMNLEQNSGSRDYRSAACKHVTQSTKSISMRILACLCTLAILALSAGAQSPPPQDPTQFDITGIIQAATVNNAANVLSGGSITVNNQRIVVPDNTILQTPATALTWQQVFTMNPRGVAGETGMAQSDSSRMPGTYEAHVIGNRVGNTYIAGLIFLAQHSLQSSQGFINYIDYSTGYFEVGGTIGLQNTGQKVKLNDPLGRFGRTFTPDARFTIDENNPTVRTETGYPMCIPRGPTATGDALCPQTNRPAGASPSGFSMIFTMVAPAGVTPGVTTDPNLMAPLEVGDFVTYAGVQEIDPGPPAFSYIAAYQVIANVGIFTAAGTDPAYVAVDVMLLGVGGQTVAGGAEATARTRFEGFTTDPSRNIQLYAIDVKPCDGTESTRDWGTIDVDQGPPGGAVMGRWRFRPPSKVLTMPASGAFTPPTREMRATIIGATATTTTNGLLAGQYQAPIFEFLFPENANVGTPIVPNNFEDFPFLAQGSGPLNGTGPLVGQLNPWPGSPVPTPASCPIPGTPTANAGPGQSVSSGSVVTLDGTSSSDSGGSALTYMWTQTAGTAVALSSSTAAKPTFTAPVVPPGPSTVLTFQLVVTNSSGTSSGPATVNITVNPTASDTVSISLVEYRTTKSRLTVDATSSASPGAKLTMQAFDGSGNPQGPPQNMPWTGALYEVILVGAAQPTTIRVTSDNGGSATSGITRLRQ